MIILSQAGCRYVCVNLFLSISLKPGPSEPRLENEEENEADSSIHEAKEQGFVPEEEFSDVSHSLIIMLYNYIMQPSYHLYSNRIK